MIDYIDRISNKKYSVDPKIILDINNLIKPEPNIITLKFIKKRENTSNASYTLQFKRDGQTFR